MPKDTTYVVKDSGLGGALPDTPGALQKAVEARRRKNEKAIEGTIKLKHGNPLIMAGLTILLRGLGPRFDGKYIVEKVTHKYNSTGGFITELKVSRNALGDSSKGEKTKADSTKGTPSEDALDGVGTSKESKEPEQVSFEEFVQMGAGS